MAPHSSTLAWRIPDGGHSVTGELLTVVARSEDLELKGVGLDPSSEASTHEATSGMSS